MVFTGRIPSRPSALNRIFTNTPNLPTTKMNEHTQRLLSTLEALFTTQVKMAEAHGLDSLPHIRLDRAKELLADIRISKAFTKHCK
jgi:hypothetical protein